MTVTTIEIPVRGMDCAHCVQSVKNALTEISGVQGADVFLTSEKAVLQIDPTQVDLSIIRKAVERAGYSVPDTGIDPPTDTKTEFSQEVKGFTRSVLTLFGVVFAAVLFIIIFGEWLGLFAHITQYIPWPVGVFLVGVGGYPIFRNVLRSALRRQVISHTLMSIGVLAALAVGQWTTALIVVFFMRVGEYAESFTTERSRRAVKDLTSMTPQKARVERDGQEQELSIDQVQIGDIVVIRPGEQIPVDGEVISGQATVNQATITGESMPVEVSTGAKVFAATFAQLGSLRLRTTQVGADTTFGKVIRLVEEAEAHRADVQRIADKVSAYYLPVVATIAALTFALRHDPLATAAVLVVACSCSFALATPIAMLASIGAGAKRGVLIKGGKYLELLSRADVLLVDKTGTLTLGQPQITDVIAIGGATQAEIVSFAASAERFSEHPLAGALRRYATSQNARLYEPKRFEVLPGSGIRAQVNGISITIGNARLIPHAASLPEALKLQAQGKTLLFMTQNGRLTAIFAASDTLRSEVPNALHAARKLGIQKLELLTGDNEQVAAALAEQLGIAYRANLLPEDKIAVVKTFQQQGHTVIMVGDGINDAPALAQADVGIAMGAAGTGIALEAAHVALMREDWRLVPEVLGIAKRTMRIVKMNIAFTIIYNIVGLSLAAFGILPPILAAAAQSLPDLGILANSSRLLRYKASSKDSRLPTQQMNEVDLHRIRIRHMYLGLIGLALLVILSFAGQHLMITSLSLAPSVQKIIEVGLSLFTLFAFIGGIALFIMIQGDKVEIAQIEGRDITADCCSAEQCSCDDSNVISLDSIH